MRTVQSGHKAIACSVIRTHIILSGGVGKEYFAPNYEVTVCILTKKYFIH